MNQLCLSAALLFLLVILVDSTLLNIHHVQDEGLETSHRWGPEKRSTKDKIKNIIRGMATGAKIANAGSGLINKVIKAIRKGNKGRVTVSGAKLKNHTVEESLKLNTQQLILSEKNKDSRPAFCLEPKVAGHGKASTPRYFYNAKTGHCELFTYGGLGRDENNFLTLEDCIKTCDRGAGSLWNCAKGYDKVKTCSRGAWSQENETEPRDIVPRVEGKRQSSAEECSLELDLEETDCFRSSHSPALHGSLSESTDHRSSAKRTGLADGQH